MINDFRGKYRFLSNFYTAPIEYDGITYQSSENAYQAAKTDDISEKRKFQWIKSSEAKQLGKLLKLRPDFELVKINVMHEIVEIKFRTHRYLADMLIATNEELQEGNWWGDRFWGTVNGEGENHLGKILMNIRKNLIDERTKP